MSPTIHYIRAWSGAPEDETPVCGAPRAAPEVGAHRTFFVGRVTCPACLEVLKREGSRAGERAET